MNPLKKYGIDTSYREQYTDVHENECYNEYRQLFKPIRGKE